jgi:signal transduction histidine kinase
MSSEADHVSPVRSLALRLGLWQAALFAGTMAVTFAAAYHFLAESLEAREREALEARAAEYAGAFARGGMTEVRALLEDEQHQPGVQALFVRLIGADGRVNWTKVPEAWSEDDIQRVPIADPAAAAASIRVAQDMARDIVVVPRALPNGGLLQVARTADNRDALLAPLRGTMAAAGVVSATLSAAAGIWLSWRATRPVREVAATARRIVRTGDLSARVTSRGGSDDVADLVHQFNTLLERNAALIGAMRATLDNVAHDLRTPLTRLRAGAEAALTEPDAATSRQALVECIEESDRIRRMLELLLDVSAAESGLLRLVPEAIDAQEVLRGVADLFSIVADEKSTRLEWDAEPGVTVWADPARLRQILANLTDNALKYTPARGQVWLRATRGAGGEAVFTVSDNGPGVPEGERDKIWRRLYRSDHSRSQRGLGLGLSIVKALVEAHRGTVGVGDRPDGGALFTVMLPEKNLKSEI